MDSDFLVAQGQAVYCVNYSCCSDQIIATTADAKPIVFDKNGNRVRIFIKGNPYLMDKSKTVGHTNSVYAACWHPHRNDTVMTASLDGTCRIWDMNGETSFDELQSRDVISAKDKGNRNIGIQSACYNLDGKGIALGCVDGGVLLFDERNLYVFFMDCSNCSFYRRRRSAANFDGHSDAVVDIRYHPTGQLFTTRGRDDVVCLWDVRNMKVREMIWNDDDDMKWIIY